MTEAVPLVPPSQRHPWSTGRARTLDVAVVAALLAPLVVAPLVRASPLSVALSLLEIAPLILRRLRPELCFWTVSCLMLGQLFLVTTPIWGQVAMPVVVYSVAAFTGRRPALVALGVGLVGSVLGPAAWAMRQSADLSYAASTMLLTALLVIAPWALGTLARTRRAYVAQLIDRSYHLEREAAQQAELAASDERARIAREMHDVVAHGLSVIVVQADGARYAAEHRPEVVGEVLEAIADTGRASLTEMRRMLGLLRADDAGSGIRPQPGLADLPYLVEQSRASGMDLDADLTDALPDVPTGVGLTVYRVVQEALTNVRKHAGPGAAVRLTVSLEPRQGLLGPEDEIMVDVLDDGRGAATQHDGNGYGLVGMRQRVDVHGGELTYGAAPGGGFRLRARIPVDGRR